MRKDISEITMEDLKEAVFLAYKEKTNDFTEDIYKDKVQTRVDKIMAIEK